MPEPFNNPNDTATAVVDKLIADDLLFKAERARIAAIEFFLNSLKAWKDTVAQGAGKTGYLIPPPPFPPAGYNFVDAPPVSTAPKSLPPGLHIGERADNGTYLEHGDMDKMSPKGMEVANPYGPGTLKKIVRNTPWGPSHYWIDKGGPLDTGV